ncbi:MAG: nickel-dependent lactate racemase [Chloracidobacterium sp.]|nr:nickel-dependent lactate racemase [Chloracidobacterium sp.]
MPTIDLKYGKTSIPFEYDEMRFETLGKTTEQPSLSDAEIGDRLDDPIDSPRLDEIIETGQTVLIVVPDATRQTGCGQVVNLVVRRLIANGTAPHDIRIIFATGIHRKVTEAEKQTILTPFIAQRTKTLDHDPRDLMQIVRLGETSGGIPIELNRALTEHDHIIMIGGVTFHYFAGFTGGRKLICPGLASSRTVSETHKLAFDCETLDRRNGVETGKLDGNAVNEAFMEVVEKIDPAFAINTIVNDAGDTVDLFCGNWRTSHRAACEVYADRHTIRVPEKRDLVIVSCGGYPYDINLIQAHKALEAASQACIDGGTIIFLAECADGLGRDDFLKWFEVDNSDELVRLLCDKYQVNGQTAWSLLKKAERFDIRVVSDLDAAVVQKMRLRKIDVKAIITDAVSTGYIFPSGAKFHITS